MKTLTLSILAATSALIAAAPASAQRYDAFESFNGTQSAGDATDPQRFIYGQADPANPGAGGTFFTATTNCFIDGSTCLQLAPNHDVPGFAKGGSPSFQYNSVNVPQDRLLGHPANDDSLTFAAFVAPTAGVYRIFASFNVQDVNPTGVDIFQIGTTNGGTPLTFQQIGAIGAANPSFSYQLTKTFTASEALGFGLGRQGFYGNDSTGLQFTVLAGVPEPTTWALMILGFGMVGGAMRRRARYTSKVSFA